MLLVKYRDELPEMSVRLRLLASHVGVAQWKSTRVGLRLF